MTLPKRPLVTLRRMIKTHVPLKVLRDLGNRLRYGAEAPLSDETIFVDPMAVTRVYLPQKPHAPTFRRRHSGMVVGGDWDRALIPLEENDKSRAIRRHFEDGLSWEETGIIDATMARIDAGEPADDLRTRDQVLARYAGIDRLYDEMRREGRLRQRQDLKDGFRREMDGIFGHVTRTGEVVRYGGGQHRFALAQVLRLPEIPMQLGVIHSDALRDGHLARLRQSRYEATSGSSD